MPDLTFVRSDANILIVHHDSATHFLSATFPTLRRHEESANIVFAHALRLLSSESALMGSHFINESDIDTWWKQETRPAPLSSASRYHVVGPPTTNTTSRRMRADGNNQTFWLTVWSSPSGSPFIPPSLEIVLSCVNWTLGDLPIILWTPRDPASLSASWLIPRIELLAKGLLNIVPPSRVFYIFGMTKLVKSSTRYWSDLVRYPIEPESLYAAYYSFCKRETFRQSYDPLPRGDSIRCANMEDLPQVAQLCKEFADDSIYFPLDIDSATVEAQELILNFIGLVWIYESEGEVAFYLCGHAEYSKCVCDH